MFSNEKLVCLTLLFAFLICCFEKKIWSELYIGKIEIKTNINNRKSKYITDIK